jgi:exopolysaccharide production protein ExoQ
VSDTAPLVDPGPRIWRRSWIAILAIALMVVSEYKIGAGRSQRAAIGGQLDSGTMVELLVYGVVAAFLLFQLSRPPRWRRWPAPLMAMWGFALAMALAATWSPFPTFALARAIQLVVVAWLAVAVAQHASAVALSRFCHAYVVVVAMSVALGVGMPVGQLPAQRGRFMWLWVHPNISGAFLGIAVTVLIALLFQRRAGWVGARWPLPAYWLLLAVNLGGLLATRSRGALSGTVVGCILVFLFYGDRRRWIDRVLLGVCVATIAWSVASSGIVNYWERGESREQLSTLNSRTEVWGQAWELFQRRPLLGHGFASARGAFLANFRLGGAHNAFVEVLVNSGIFGTAWWIALLVVALAGANRLWQRRRPEGPLLLAVLGFLIVNGLTASGLGQAATVQVIWLAVVVGWLVAAPRLRWVPTAGPPPRPRLATPMLADAGAGSSSGVGQRLGGPEPTPLGRGTGQEDAQTRDQQ